MMEIVIWFQRVWMNIGSVEGFERSLDAAQQENGVEPANYIPVIYKMEFTL